MPESVLMRVDLPAPFSPQGAWISPGRRSKSTPPSATTGPNRLMIRLAFRIVSIISRLLGLGRAKGFGEVPVDFVVAVEAVLDDRVEDVGFVHGVNGLHYGGNVHLAIVDDAVRDDRLTQGHVSRGIGGEFGELFDGLVNGHRLGAGGDALEGGDVGVLAGDEVFTTEAGFGELLDRAAGGAVIAGENAVESLAADDGGVHDSLGVFGTPVVGPVFPNDFDVFAVKVGLESLVLALLEHEGVVIG